MDVVAPPMVSPAQTRSAKALKAQEVASRLADPQLFTGVYKRRHEMGGFGKMYSDGGDYCSYTIRACKPLMNRSYRDLTIPHRSADFRTETEWKLSLRPFL
eukprot:TRINITY_DN10052_c0_g1_i2.p4 TRINITY_DN10052_c0_g1~~TRINITY_DN10052_c0_g1_i2.p4  ORF type:complete len:101 (+),score=20.89 TRINITY_DN10052_c0_g1_i2:541-843(+)